MNTKIEVLLCQGTQNKFVLVSELENSLNISEKMRHILSYNLCHKEAFDTNGILYIQKSDDEACVGKMRMFNTDGSEAEMCGNGIRCVGRFIAEYTGKDDFIIETKLGKVKIRHMENIYKDIPTYSALINPVNLNCSSLPMIAESKTFTNSSIDGLLESEDTFTAMSVQNPHIVFIRDEIDRDELLSFGDIINSRLDIFPNQVNINFVKILDNNSIYVLTNERGSGITPSCGTGMSSSAYVSCLLGHMSFSQPTNVYNDGGKVICIADEKEGTIQLIGNATYIEKSDVVFDGKCDLASIDLIHTYIEERIEYTEFMKECLL